MAGPGFHHLLYTADWLRCDHQDTAVHPPTGTVRLATHEAGGQTPVAESVYQDWLAVRGGAVNLPCAPDLCDPLVHPPDTPARRGGILLGDAGGALWQASEAGYRRLEPAPTPPPPATALRFGAAQPAPAAACAGLAALALDPRGRLWLLDRDDPHRIRLLRLADLGVAHTLSSPPGHRLSHLDTGERGALAVARATRALWWQPYGGEWLRVSWTGLDRHPWAHRLAEYEPVSVAAGPGERFLVLFRHRPGVLPSPAPDYPLVTPRRIVGAPRGEATPRALVAILAGDTANLAAVPDLEDPLHLLVLPGGDVLVTEISAPPGGRTHLTRFAVTRDGLAASQRWLARAFDGRALVLDEAGRPWATTARGLRRLYRIQDPLRTEGILETFALDSEVYGLQWHRVFLDVCLPPGTGIEVQARAADELYPETLLRDPEPPEGYDAPGDPRPVLGSRSREDREGWFPLEALDRRAPLADIPYPPRGELPADDPYPRGEPTRADLVFETLEGLLPVPPGRYLWLRIRLRGSRHSTPALLAVRATRPRPSLLDYLPAFWRRDPETARLTERFLALFEGELSTLDRRIDVLRHLADPRITPAEALPWLGSLVALGFDTRLDEAVRRQLIQEAMALYRRRGTVPGLERLCEILAGARVQIIEGFRLRPAPGAILDGEAGLPPPVLGATATLVSGWAEALEPWEQALLAAWRALIEHRDALRAAPPPPEPGPDRCCQEPAELTGPPCPAQDPPHPLDLDPLITFYRHYAHRFTVILYTCRDPDLAEIIEQAVEAWKPAHTLHELCWLDPGLRVGVNSYVGLGTRLADGGEPVPAVVGSQAWGPGATVFRAGPGRDLAGERI